MKPESFELDSYCGLYCGACEILNLYRRCLDRGGTAQWESLPNPVRDNIPRAEVLCHGCRTDVVFQGCRGCRIRECARKKAVRACPECSDFPCEFVRALRERLPASRNILPHTEAIFGNIDIAADRGLEAWIEQQRKQWECPGCGEPFTWYQERCRGCGKDLRTVRGY